MYPIRALIAERYQRNFVWAPHPERIRSSTKHHQRLAIHQHRAGCQLIGTLIVQVVVAVSRPLFGRKVKTQNLLVQVVRVVVLLKIIAAEHVEVVIVASDSVTCWRLLIKLKIWKKFFQSFLFTTSRSRHMGILCAILLYQLKRPELEQSAVHLPSNIKGKRFNFWYFLRSEKILALTKTKGEGDWRNNFSLTSSAYSPRTCWWMWWNCQTKAKHFSLFLCLLQEKYFSPKRTKPSLSIVNPLDVLRQRVMLEMARRQRENANKQVRKGSSCLCTSREYYWNVSVAQKFLL